MINFLRQRMRAMTTYDPHHDSPTAYIAAMDDDDRLSIGEQVDHLIATSIAQDCIAHEDYADGLAAMLEAQSEECTIGTETIEYLGADEDGREWRVHLSLPETE
jgi:hypothetical protein